MKHLLYGCMILVFFSLQGMVDYTQIDRLKEERINILQNLPEIETARLILRKMELNDAPSLFALTSNEKLFKHSRVIQPHTTLAEAEAYVSTILAQYEKGEAPFWLCTLKTTQDVIGLARFYGINHSDHKALLGYLIKPEYWNQGYATEAVQAVVKFACDTLHVHRIEASVDPRNSSSIRVLEKLDMILEGYARHYMFVNGEFEDRKLYALLNPADTIRKPLEREASVYKIGLDFY